jgi:hypothetical protein
MVVEQARAGSRHFRRSWPGGMAVHPHRRNDQGRAEKACSGDGRPTPAWHTRVAPLDLTGQESRLKLKLGGSLLRKKHDIATVCTVGQMGQHTFAFRCAERALGEGGEQVLVGMRG